jgi:integrase
MTTETISPLRQRMIEDMNARKLCAGTRRGHISSCKRFATFLKCSPDTATLEDIRRFQLHLAETGTSICNRNRIMTGLRFLFRVTLRRLDLAAEIYHLREPQKIPLVMSTDETKRLLAVASSLKARLLLSLGYGCGLRAGEVQDVPDIHPNISEAYRRRIERLTEALSHPDDALEATEAIREVIDRIVITPGKARGENHVTLQGDLATILEWIDRTGKPGYNLYLVGDIIDGWAMSRGTIYFPQEHVNILRRFLNKARKGSHVT